MTKSENRGVWESGADYEPYVGRWSRVVAREFLKWLDIPPSARWLDVGCGTGALSETILAHSAPAEIHAVDPSEGYLSLASKQLRDSRIHFEVADARRLPMRTATYDAVVSGLLLNFVPELTLGMAEMVRVTDPGGTVAAYVWDYAGKIKLMRYFWDAAVTLKPEARERDEGRRFPLCQPQPLVNLFAESGLQDMDVRPIDVPTHFKNFDDYWLPFLGGQFPAPDYAMSLSEADRAALREQIRVSLRFSEDARSSSWRVPGQCGANGLIYRINSQVDGVPVAIRDA